MKRLKLKTLRSYIIHSNKINVSQSNLGIILCAYVNRLWDCINTLKIN